MKRHERGLAMVEFSIIATVLVTVMFALIEFGRLFYTFSMLNEGMRRAARLAAVCPIGSAEITNTATFNGIAELPGFDPGTNMQVQYLDVNGNPTAAYGAINYVQVQVVGYSIPLGIPFFTLVIPAPAFAVTLPRESLGVTPTNYSTC